MTWLVWRQHRYELLGLVLGGVLIALALVWGVAVATTVREELEVDRCQPTLATNVNCTLLAVQAGERVQPFRWLLVALFFLPAIVGSFIGGPLFSREFERGTQRFAWSQAVSRLRWSAGKLGALMAAGAIGGLAVALAGSPGRAINGGGPNAFTNFDIEGPAFVSYVLFAIAVCAFVGTISRRIITGMFVGLLVFGGARLAVMYELRPNYLPPITVTYGVTDAYRWGQFKVPDGAWHLGTQYINANGDAVPSGLVTELYRSYVPPRSIYPVSGIYDPMTYLAERGVFQRLRYHPADRYDLFQWIEATIFLVLSGAFVAGTLLVLRKRDA
jgi:hypothetical protein